LGKLLQETHLFKTKKSAEQSIQTMELLFENGARMITGELRNEKVLLVIGCVSQGISVTGKDDNISWIYSRFRSERLCST